MSGFKLLTVACLGHSLSQNLLTFEVLLMRHSKVKSSKSATSKEIFVNKTLTHLDAWYNKNWLFCLFDKYSFCPKIFEGIFPSSY